MKKGFLVFFTYIFINFDLLANPLILGYEASLSNYLISSGIAENKEEADSISRDFSNDYFGSNSRTCRQGRFFSDCEIGSAIAENAPDGTLRFKDSNGNIGELQVANMIGKYHTNDILRRLYKDSAYGDLIFSEKRPFENELDYLNSFINSYNFSDYAIAPLELASTGSFVYRSKDPVNKKGDFAFANSLPMLYYAYFFDNEVINLKDEKVDLNVIDDFVVTIYREDYELFGSGINSKLEEGIEVPAEISSNFPLTTYLKHSIFNVDKETIQMWYEMAKDEGGTKDDYIRVFGGIDESMFTVVNKKQMVIDVIRNREDILSEDDTVFNNEPEEITYATSHNLVSDEKAENYILSNDDLTNVYNNIFKSQLKQRNHTITRSSGQKITFSENTSLNKKNILDGFATNGVRSITLRSFRDKSSVNQSYHEVQSTRREILENDDKDKNKIPPSLPADDFNGDSTTPPNTGSGVDNTGTNSTTGDSSGVSANSNSERVGSRAISTTNTDTQSSEEDKEEEKIKFKDPVLPEVSAFEILKPLLDLKQNLISKIEFNIPSGSCPVFNINFFENNLTLDVHCKVIESISSGIGILMLLIYNLFAIRIILSS